MEITKHEVSVLNPTRRTSKAFSVLGGVNPTMVVKKSKIPNVFLQESESEDDQI